MSDNVGSRKELFVLLPVVGSAIAITYDVGYFYALDINFFTVFTISEHIAFALEILPVAILATIILIVTPIAWDKGRRSGAAEARREITTGIKTKFYKTKFFWTQLAFFIWLVGLAYFYRSATSIAIVLIYAGAIILAEWFAIYLLLQPMVWLGASSLACLTLSFTVGMDVATSYRNSTIYSYAVKTADRELKVKVVRSGERGLLFHEEVSKQLLLLPWNEIKQVSTSRPART
jgi:hypothetical protein